MCFAPLTISFATKGGNTNVEKFHLSKFLRNILRFSFPNPTDPGLPPGRAAFDNAKNHKPNAASASP